MQHLFGPQGAAALAETMHRRPLLAFDFDGTLAPIVARPDDARVPRPVAERMNRLATRLPVAIVTGRSVEDVRSRLGFAPRYIVGSHGAEDGRDAAAAERHARRLDRLRLRLGAHADALARTGVRLEDKGQSIALHYRLAPDGDAALALVRSLLAPGDDSIRLFDGKMVVNAVSADSNDKAAAVHALVSDSAADSAFFAGDDVNDEPVFAAAAPHWLTVRIGRDEPGSRARFFLDSPSELALLLEHMLRLLPD